MKALYSKRIAAGVAITAIVFLLLTSLLIPLAVRAPAPGAGLSVDFRTPILTVNGQRSSLTVSASSPLAITVTSGTPGASVALWTEIIEGTKYTAMANGHFDSTGKWIVTEPDQKAPASKFSYYLVAKDYESHLVSNYVKVTVPSTPKGTIVETINKIPLDPTLASGAHATITISGVASGAKVSVYEFLVYPFKGSKKVLETGTADGSGVYSFSEIFYYPSPLPSGVKHAEYATVELWGTVGDRSSAVLLIYIHQ
jgi:hypothetical protein